MLSRTMANNHPLLSLYENPLAAGIITTDGQGKTSGDDRLVGYLIRSAKNESATELAPVASLQHVPPRADAAFAPVASLPNLPPRNYLEFAAVASIPSLPPRA
jgi:hypothetical protein